MVPIPFPEISVSLGSSELVKRRAAVGKPTTPNGLILEAWSQGYMVGSLIVLACITLSNMRKGVLLHKLILLELLMSIWHGFWIFFNAPLYGWWLSTSAVFLNTSYVLHNVISWMKLRPFLSRRASQLFIGTTVLSLVYWGFELYANFRFFNGYDRLFKRTRPWEALSRDPWWIISTVYLFWIIKNQYDMTFREITRISPRFAIMLVTMVISIIFVITDVCSVLGVFSDDIFSSVNPFWKLATIFKCLTDVVVLDDFKTALDRLRAFQMSRITTFSSSTGDRNTGYHGTLKTVWEEFDPNGGKTCSCHVGQSTTRPSAWGISNLSLGMHGSLIYSDPGTNFAPEDLVPSVLRDVPIPDSMKEAHVKDADKRVK